MSETESLAATAEFAVSQEPRISAAAAERSTGGSFDGENLSELPRTYGGQTLVAIARDPHTIFVYWDIDWPLAFQAGEPADH